MTAAVTAAPLRPARTHASFAVIGLLVASCIFVDLHLRLSGQLSPLRHTVSEYVYGRFETLSTGAFTAATAFSTMCLAFALGSAALLAGVHKAHRRRHPVAITALATWCAGLVVLALFPVDLAGGERTWHGEIHNYAAVVSFVALPIAALMLTRDADHGPWRRHRRSIRALAWVSALAIASVFGSFIWNSVFAPPGMATMTGLFERVMFALDLALLLALARPLLGRKVRAGASLRLRRLPRRHRL